MVAFVHSRGRSLPLFIFWGIETITLLPCKRPVMNLFEHILDMLLKALHTYRTPKVS